MTIDPRWGFWFSILAALISALLLCGAEFTTLFGDVETGRILAWLVIGNAAVNSVNAVLHAIPASIPIARDIARKFYLG